MKCLIVDDELQSRNTLKEEIISLNKGYKIIGEADSVADAIEQINQLHPDIILLDIELADGSGFDVVNATQNSEYKIIFVTAYNQYAIKAFRISAIDYLLKPVNANHLEEALNKAVQANDERIGLIKERYESALATNQRIAFASNEGYSLHFINDIIRCESDNNYCNIYMVNNEKLFVSKTLKELEDLLAKNGFERIHQSHLVNMKHVKKYLNRDNGTLVMSDGSLTPVAQRKKNQVLSLLQQYLV